MLTLFKDIFRAFLPLDYDSSPDEGSSLSISERYKRFHNLLTANNNALEAMAELEKLYHGSNSYEMAEVRTRILAVLVNVYKMINNLLEMSGNKYVELEQVYEIIKNKIDHIVLQQPETVDGPYVISLENLSLSDSGLTGGKMAVLGELTQHKSINVPKGFVLTASATRYFLGQEFPTEVNRRLQILEPDNFSGLYSTCENLQKAVLDLEIPTDLKEQLYYHYKKLNTKDSAEKTLVALRSSAHGEDVAGISYAGLYKTLLNIDHTQLEKSYKEIIASKYCEKAIAYRRHRGVRHEDVEMCVGCLEMIDSAVGGVAYSCYPDKLYPDTIRINATTGNAKGVVDGTNETEMFLIQRNIPHDILCYKTGLKKEEKSVSTSKLLTHSQLNLLAKQILKIEKLLGGPQDIEWCFDISGKLYILQSRDFKYSLPPAASDPAKNHSAETNSILVQGGTRVSSGIAFGEVCYLTQPKQGVDFPDKGILIIKHPLPEWSPVLYRASAVLAETGSEAGHLATMAREFGIPAIFGLQNICDQLENGQSITVDGDEGIIYEGKLQNLEERQKARYDIMAGSPVQHIVSEAMEYITPLHLYDPASYKFKPSHCKSLHDITRFCHEKSVEEMFQADQSHKKEKNDVKRLVANVPLEWRIINLADGFRDNSPYKGQSIHIDDIVSTPMLAIWQGISAYPWQGPPPLNVKGFGSIILQSAMRADLDPAVATRLTSKNYFLISRNFCNLNVRLGYHYAMIESYISDLLTESYITFRFKGGAADMNRKCRRTRMLADILEKYDFDIQLRSDALVARINKKPQDYLELRLKVVGYLILHARQLDMVMHDEKALKRYKQRFVNEIETLTHAS